MQSALAGDSRAYRDVLHQSSVMLRPFLGKYLGNRAETEDVLQEILISIHKARHTYDGMRPFRPWLFAIAKFRLKDFLRKHYADKIHQAVDIADFENILSETVTESIDAHEVIQEGMKYLSPKQAEIVSLIHVDGQTAREAAKTLGMNESAVKVAAHRAYKILREKLQEKTAQR